jgi:hypothetical protein
LLSALGALPVLAATTRFTPVQAQRSGDWLPSWNDGPAKSSITDFVARVTSGPDFVPEDQRFFRRETSELCLASSHPRAAL